MSEPPVARRRAGFARSLKAVGWSFFGVRKSTDYEHDVAELKPHQVVVAALLVALAFVLLLVGLVKWVLSSGVAAAN